MISVVLATSRPSVGAMLGYPHRDHLEYTLQSLLDQRDAPPFEVVIADCLHGTSLRVGETLRGHPVPIYHVPVASPWFDHDPPLPAICRARNVGIAHAAGDFVVFLDDCCWVPPKSLFWWQHWRDRGSWFANALHVRMEGNRVHCHDARFDLLKGRYWHFNDFGLNGYMSASMEALLRINGFDEAFDGSRQLEDGDLGHRLRAAGYRLVLDPRLVVYEQVHDAPRAPSGVHYGNPPRCNGVWAFLKREEGVGGRVEANRRSWTAVERDRARPCGYLSGTRCVHVGAECNMWVGGVVGGRHTHEDLPGEFLEAPVFDLASERSRCLAGRDRWRVG